MTCSWQNRSLNIQLTPKFTLSLPHLHKAINDILSHHKPMIASKDKVPCPYKPTFRSKISRPCPYKSHLVLTNLILRNRHTCNSVDPKKSCAACFYVHTSRKVAEHSGYLRKVHEHLFFAFSFALGTRSHFT